MNETAYYYLRPTGRPGQIETDGAGSLFIQTLARRPAVPRVAVARSSCDAVCFSFSRDQFIFMTAAPRVPHFFRLIFQRFPDRNDNAISPPGLGKNIEEKYAPGPNAAVTTCATTRTVRLVKTITRDSVRPAFEAQERVGDARSKHFKNNCFPKFLSVIVCRPVTRSHPIGVPYRVPYWLGIHHGSDKEK